MGPGWLGGAIFGAAMVFPAVVSAQDVTLTAREGGLSVSGLLQGFDGEFYRIESAYGMLTIDAAGVICDGPACPDLLAPKADLRITGLAGIGDTLVPALVRRFAEARGLEYAEDQAAPDYMARLNDPETGKTLAEISFAPEAPGVARESVLAGRAELVLSAATDAEFGARVVAMDALLPIVAPDNPLPRISTRDLARVLSGKVDNWSAVGGPDMPLVLHGLASGNSVETALSGRLGRAPEPLIRHETLGDLAVAVADDPWAVAVTLRGSVGAARVLPLTDSCGFPLVPSSLAVKAEDYPLSLPLFFLTPKRRLPLMVREFLDFLAMPQAQAAIAEAGFIDRAPERQAMTADGLRLINAINGAGEEIGLPDLKRLVEEMEGAERLSLTFRFEDGAAVLDAQSRESLADLARLIETDAFQGHALTLAGFSDGSGDSVANQELSLKRADGVLAELRGLMEGVPESDMPRVVPFGEILPIACDETPAGRRLNRRVEVWLHPAFTPDAPTNEN